MLKVLAARARELEVGCSWMFIVVGCRWMFTVGHSIGRTYGAIKECVCDGSDYVPGRHKPSGRRSQLPHSEYRTCRRASVSRERSGTT